MLVVQVHNNVLRAHNIDEARPTELLFAVAAAEKRAGPPSGAAQADAGERVRARGQRSEGS